MNRLPDGSGYFVAEIDTAARYLPMKDTSEMTREELLHLIEWAWGIIANAGGGDWTRESDDWQKAAHRWGVDAGFRCERAPE